MSIFPAGVLHLHYNAISLEQQLQCNDVVVGHMLIGSSDCGIRRYQKHSCISSHKKTELSVCEVFLHCSESTHTVKTTIQIKTFILFAGFKCR